MATFMSVRKHDNYQTVLYLVVERSGHRNRS